MKIHWKSFVLILAVLSALWGVPQAQAGDGPKDTKKPVAQDTSPDYRLGPGDLLSIQVFGLDDLNQETRISNSGKIHVPYLGLLSVGGLSAAELETGIARRLEEKQLIRDPKVHVFVTEYRGQPVYCLGEVMMPGQFIIMDKQMHLMDLLTMAGGANEVASSTAYLYRRGASALSAKGEVTAEETPKMAGGDSVQESPDYQVIPVDIDALREGSQIALNVSLKGGDVFYVPERKRNFFYVVGDVGHPGAYEIPQGEQLLATQALSSAGGLPGRQR